VGIIVVVADDVLCRLTLQQEAQALLTSTRRLSSLRREYDMLFYSLNGARIFFKRS
jgi:hypothetical protein